ncbi:SAM-dependent methyltransferase [Williamsia sp. CHRR-6]|uniref:class I SAM-dependent methyltransferase n=1 Tax=Williamsia sp. CHRR-6 TaxID=2835871 RepID=UPI001BD97CE0|nr:SAM-dependent methyltransferase [Williamsia sp. CHRR-6]MBT0568632.1 class I SAM-dependent methyltransferase [Williamsia sp. CHRR-6]
MTLDVSSVGTTAVITAQMRAIESARDDRLFSDELASKLVAAAGLGIENVTLEQVEGQRVYVSLAVRTHYLDSWCDRLLGERAIRQVVILGAGLDTRAIRLGWLEAGVSVFEIDRSDVSELKAEGLGIGPDKNWHGIAADLTSDSWGNGLVAAGFDTSEPAVFIAEGLFMYIEESANQRILRRINNIAAPGSYLLAVHFGRGALIDAETQAMSLAVGSNGYAFESVIESAPAEWVGPSWSVESALSIAQYAPEVGRQIPYDENKIGAEVTWMFAARAIP